MSECTHEGDHWWNHDEKKSYCCACRQPCGPRPVTPPPEGSRGSGMRREGPTFGFHTDHSGYQVDGGYWHCGADQT